MSKSEVDPLSHECSACRGSGLLNENWGTVERAWNSYCRDCPHHIPESTSRRPSNALNVEVSGTMARCTIQPPSIWPKVDTASAREMGFRWLSSGGSPLVFGPCCLGACPFNPRFCSVCGHREDAGHALGVCRTHDSGPGGSWPCGCGEYVDMHCPVCLGSGRVSDRVPREDAIADAATLIQLLVDEPLGDPDDNLELCLSGCMSDEHNAVIVQAVRRGYSVKAASYGRRAAHAAFRAVPGLRGE